MGSRIWFVVGVVAIVAAVVFGLGAMWWWAVVGMSPEVGQASFYTAFVLLVVGCVAVTLGVDV